MSKPTVPTLVSQIRFSLRTSRTPFDLLAVPQVRVRSLDANLGSPYPDLGLFSLRTSRLSLATFEAVRSDPRG
jgi:hypothetical protein